MAKSTSARIARVISTTLRLIYVLGSIARAMINAWAANVWDIIAQTQKTFWKHALTILSPDVASAQMLLARHMENGIKVTSANSEHALAFWVVNALLASASAKILLGIFVTVCIVMEITNAAPAGAILDSARGIRAQQTLVLMILIMIVENVIKLPVAMIESVKMALVTMDNAMTLISGSFF